MYRFRKEQVLEGAFLTKLVRRFQEEYTPRFLKDERYYRTETKILERTMTSGKPNNRLAHGFCRYITNMATSYFLGKPVRYQVKDEDYQESLNGVFSDNHIDALNFEVSKEASKKGIGYLLLFINESSQLRIKKLSAEEVIPVYSPSLDEFLEAAVRIWEERDIDGTLLCEYADVYDDMFIYHYKRPAGTSGYEKAGDTYQEPHRLGDVPVIVVWNNEEQAGDYEPVITLTDGYDKAQSDTGNDMEYFTDAYLTITGASEVVEAALTGDEEDGEGQKAIRDFRKNKILLLDENGQAQWLVKNVNDTATENYKDRLYRDIFLFAQVPALTDESFSGNLSGIAIKYKLIGLEELSIMKENKFRSAQNKLLQLVTGYLNTKMNKGWDPDSVETKFERNFVENVSDIIEYVKNLEGIVSRETQLDCLPPSIVEDTGAEINRIRKETADAEGLPLADLKAL